MLACGRSLSGSDAGQARLAGRVWLVRFACLLAIGAGFATASARAVETYRGEARSQAGAPVLYTESHWVDGDRHVVLYACPDGRAFARKRLDLSRGATAPDFAVEDGRDGYRQGVRSEGDRRVVYVRAAGSAPERTATLDRLPVIDAGFDAFVREHWDRLAAGSALPMRFLVPSRLKAMSFEVRQVRAGDGRRTFRLSLGSLLGRLLPAIDVDYDAHSRRLLGYRGLTDVRDGHGGLVTAEIRFPPEAYGREQRSIASAVSAPLDGRCRL